MPDTVLDYTSHPPLSNTMESTRNETVYSQTNGLPMSALLTDPSFRKKPSFNGITSFPLHSRNPTMEPRQKSEPPSAAYPSFSFDFEIPAALSKDDAHLVTQGQSRGSSKTSKQPGMTVPQPSFDARQLLDPKGYNSSQSQKDRNIHMLRSGPSVLSSTNGTLKRNGEDLEGQGMGNMIERMHGVSQRDERPPKKQKNSKSDEEDEKKAIFTTVGKGGELGEYMREKRKEGQANNVPNGDVVDLTAGMNSGSALHIVC